MTSSASAGSNSVETSSDPQPTLRSRALRAASWRTGAYVASQLFRVLSSIVLAALLFPAAFGLVALGTIIIQGLRMFSELGIGPAIIQRKENLDDNFLNTAWTLQILRGSGLWVGGALLAWPMAWLYGEPRLVALLIVIGSIAVIDGLQSTAIFTLSRQLHEGRRAALDLSSEILGRSIMIIWALIWPTYWALIGGTLIAAAFKASATHVWLPGIRHHLCWHPPSVRALVNFGKWVFIGTVFAFFGQQLDKLMLGGLDAIGVLGVYTFALTFASLPREGVMVIASAVLFPALAEVNRQNPDRFHERVFQIQQVILPLSMFATLGVGLMAPEFFRWFFDDRYSAAIWMTPLVALTTWVLLLTTTSSQALLALGMTRALAFAGLARILSTAAACMAGYLLMGLPGFILGTTVGAIRLQVALYTALRHTKVRLLPLDAIYTAVLLTIALLTLVGQHLLQQHLAPELALWAVPLLTVIVLTIVGLWTARQTLPRLLNR